MKVLVLLEYGLPHYREFIFEYLDEISDDFLVIHTGEDYKAKDYSFDTIRCDLTKVGIGRLAFHRDIWKYVREYDVIIGSFNFWRPMCWLPAYLTNKKCILWGQAFTRMDNVFSRGIKKSTAWQAEAVLLYTDRGKKYYNDKLNIDPNKVFVTGNTLDIPNHTFTREDRRYFLYVGRIQRRKQLDNMISVMSSIKKERGLNGEILRIIGDGPPTKDLKQLAEEEDVAEHVNFVGAVYKDEELIKHFSGALGYISPGHVGLGVVHSFSYGIPVITDRNENHAPEFYYCTDENSFLYEGRKGLESTVMNLLDDNEESYIKGKAAYDYYYEKLSARHTKEMFYQAITH